MGYCDTCTFRCGIDCLVDPDIEQEKSDLQLCQASSQIELVLGDIGDFHRFLSILSNESNRRSLLLCRYNIYIIM